VSVLPSFEDVCRIVDHVAALRSGGARYAALFAAVGMAGLRPSEAIGAQIGDVDLPSTGWGLIRLRGTTTAPGVRCSQRGVLEAQP
jgi:integrase